MTPRPNATTDPASNTASDPDTVPFTVPPSETTETAETTETPSRSRPWAALVVGAVAAAGIPAIWFLPVPPETGGDARLTLLVFASAVWLWVFSSVPDTLVALTAACVLVVAGVIEEDALFSPLGDSTIWLLIGAFIVASAISATGLADRAASLLCNGVTSSRALVHLLTLAAVTTAFVVPATSGRAALVLPVFLVVARALPRWLGRVLAVALPGVVLFSAVASLIGAGAHLITVQILTAGGEEGIPFTRWLVLGLPFALVTSHLAAEIILQCLSTPEQRRQRLDLSLPATKPLSAPETRVLVLLTVVTVLWFTEGLHGIPPALVAVLGAVLAASPVVGTVTLKGAMNDVPWSLLIFMAATVALSTALTESGAVQVLTGGVFAGLHTTGFVIVVIVVSALAHLVVQSRSARSAVLVPLVLALAPAAGVNPVAAAFISTAAAGYCHTMASSAKPLTIFRGDDTTDGQDDDLPRFTASDLLLVSAFLFPMFLCVTVVFAFVVWPALGLPLTL
ncbi:SLC13 family permease [Corynebacterium kalidii]|uniref:Anion permease n=1 Tax=Corynebacterium kalidii TaxID=2931982 RepID=A0A9X1WM86_9CORY|nr:SLC13 family permease [Corynebacterium kalidii]MCJ7857581.1 anion permease [Corynebacterium kalidii]